MIGIVKITPQPREFLLEPADRARLAPIRVDIVRLARIPPKVVKLPGVDFVESS